MTRFPRIYLRGTPSEIGFSHGVQLKDRIPPTINFYKKVFKQSEEDIFRQASHFQKLLLREMPEYHEEIEAIAKGADVNPLWIYALNARSEILTMFVTECTAIYSSESAILAQNWDWARALEDLVILLDITHSDGRRVLTLTEPGIIGKIGFNSNHLGVTLNFLYAPGKLDGIPVHVMLRALLDCITFEDGKSLVEKYHKGKGGNIIWASDRGDYVNYEFANNELYEFNTAKTMVHTNHYLGNEELNNEREKLASSLNRFKRATELVEKPLNQSDIQSLLLDINSSLPICRAYIHDEELGDIGTVCTIIMDLKSLTFRFTPGNPFDTSFQSVEFKKGN